MKTNEVLQKFFKKHGAKKLASALGLSAPFLYKWCQRDGGKASGGWNPMARVSVLTAATGDVSLVEHLCEAAGGRFVLAGDMPAVLRSCWEEFKTEMEALLKAAPSAKKPGAGNGKLGLSPNSPLPAASSPLPGSREAGGSRCRHRLPDGRCGFPAARRN